MIGIYRRWRRRRDCFHHDARTGISWIGRGVIVDWRKLYRCDHCDKRWII